MNRLETSVGKKNWNKKPFVVLGGQMMYFLDPSQQEKAIATATNLSNDITGRNIAVRILQSYHLK